tara:strand:+ start:315 stop:998 length:684 start_codon:yes stop_codon:yes gene_type:complete
LEKLNRWSYSRLATFERCPKQFYYSSVAKIETPQHPAAERGTRIHDAAERYIKGEDGVFPKDLLLFKEAFEDLQTGYQAGTVVVEEDWAFDIDWKPIGWDEENTWGRYKIDAYIQEPDRTVVIDFKTGRYAGNEKTHEAQCALYAVATANRFPKVKNVQAELWYLDHGKISRHQFTKKDIKERKKNFHDRAMILSTATEFKPTPSLEACRWCHFGKAGICRDVHRFS